MAPKPGFKPTSFDAKGMPSNDSPVTSNDDRADSQHPSGSKLFDITCIVGTVFAGGTQDPRVAAFALIGEHGADGEFTFPDEDGATIHVSVYTTP